MASSTALYARASFHGDVVEETFVQTHEALQIGHSPALAVPVPDDLPFLARIVWTSPTTCAVQDGRGAVHVLEAGHDVVLTLGPVELRLYLVHRRPVARVEGVSPTWAVAWLALVVMSVVFVSQVAWFGERSCQIAITVLPGIGDMGVPLLVVFAPIAAVAAGLFAILSAESPGRTALAVAPLPLIALLVPALYRVGGFEFKSGEQFLVDEFGWCMPPPGADGGGSPMTAEYLARLLRRDLDGEERGVIETEVERPTSERKLRDNEIFMPAGSRGPITKMGGAEETASKPVRTVPTEETIAVKSKAADRDPLTADNGSPIERPDAPTDPTDGVADGLDVPKADDAEGADAPAEEKEGWGIPAWYDEQDQAMDDMEIDLMLRLAKNRLAIDPDDAAALSILSYYQYLAQDFDAAKKTYDRFIELYPDDPAGYNNKALVYKRQGEYQKEESLYRVALSLSPNDVTAMNNLGVNLSHQKRFDEALAVMRELEILDPEDPYADLHRSKIQAEMGNDEESLRYLALALDRMSKLDTLHHIEFRQDIRLDPSFARLRETYRFKALLDKYYGKDSPLGE